MNPDKFWKSLKTGTRNSLLRVRPSLSKFVHDSVEVKFVPAKEPWDMSVKELIRIPGIGPQAIAEIARLTEKYCV